MSEKSESTQGTPILSLLGDALEYPLRRWPWWLVIAGCASLNVALFWVGQHSQRLPGGLVYGSLLLYGVIIRCYFSAMETTVSGYGEEAWQGSGFSMDGLWSSMGTILGLAAVSWAPALLLAFVLESNEMSLEPWVSIAGALGCEYFCMALIGTVVFGGFAGALPQHVLPAIMRSGLSYGVASLSLMVIPWTLEFAYQTWWQKGLPGMLATFVVMAYVLLAQARMTGLVYLANKEKIAWE